MALESIYPEDFFNIPHPVAPNIAIQVRTTVNPDAEIDDPSHWESITFNPNTYFDNMSLEDKGGALSLDLSLFDQNFSNLENTVIRSLVATRLANKLVQDPDYEPDPSYFEFYVSKANSANLRIRFGYSESYSDDFIDANSITDSVWKSRTEKNGGSIKPVLRTPWLYFQMSGIDFNLTSKGLELKIKAFSIMSSFLNQAKMVEQYARLFGEPVFVIDQLMQRVVEAATNNNETVTYEIKDRPRGYYSQEDGLEIIEIMLGGEPVIETLEDGSQRASTRYKSMSSILNELCSKIRPLKYDADGNEIPENTDSSGEAEGEKAENEEADQIHRYSYYIQENPNETKIVFYYQDPQRSINEQGLVRVYSWLQEGNSIVKELNIKTKTDFATLSLPIVNIDRTNGGITVQVARGRGKRERSSETSNEDDIDFTVGHIRDVSEAFSDENFRAMFVRHVRDTDNDEVTNNRMTPAQLGAVVSSQIVARLNEQIFTGTIKIPGDAFYLFDEKIQPFSYLIKIIVNKPNYVDENGDFVPGGQSYLSGYYMVKKITHSLSISGFETELEVMKFNSRGN